MYEQQMVSFDNEYVAPSGINTGKQSRTSLSLPKQKYSPNG